MKKDVLLYGCYGENIKEGLIMNIIHWISFIHMVVMDLIENNIENNIYLWLYNLIFTPNIPNISNLNTFLNINICNKRWPNQLHYYFITGWLYCVNSIFRMEFWDTCYSKLYAVQWINITFNYSRKQSLCGSEFQFSDSGWYCCECNVCFGCHSSYNIILWRRNP